MTLLCRLVREEDGGEILEVAVAMPVFVLLTFGLVQMFLFLYCYVAATYGSRAAVRYASVHGAASLSPCSANDLAALVRSYAAVIPSSGVQTTTTWTPGNSNAVGNGVSVQVQLSYATGLTMGSFRTLTVSTTAAGTIIQ